MKKVLLWMGIAFVLLVGCMVIFAMVGLTEALNLEIGTVSLTDATDGLYPGEYRNGRFSNSVNVLVENHAIADVLPVKIADGQGDLAKTLTASVIKEQTPAVDVIAGATASSKSFLKAVEVALRQAVGMAD